MDALEVIFERRSCRNYCDAPISREMVETILLAGMSAPSAVDSKPWEFLVVEDDMLKGELSNVNPNWWMLKQAPVGIIIMANISSYRSRTTEFFVQDCACSAMCMLLAVDALGLGGVYLGLYPKQLEMNKVRALFEIPESIIPFSILAFGHPKELAREGKPYNENVVHYEKYQSMCSR